MWSPWRRQERSFEEWQPSDHLPATMVPGFADSTARAAEFISDSRRPDRTANLPAVREAADALPFVSEGPQGHRKRMRDRLLDRGPESLADYELLEMLLFFAQPTGDTKPVAKRLINRFGSYAGALCASNQDLDEVTGIGRTSVAAIRLVHAAALRLARAEVLDRIVLGNWDQLMSYLNMAMSRERVEQFRILFLDTRNQLIAGRSAKPRHHQPHPRLPT